MGASIFVPRSRNYYADIHYALLLGGIHRGCGLHLATSVPSIDVRVANVTTHTVQEAGYARYVYARVNRGVITTDHRTRGWKKLALFFDFYARLTLRPFILMLRSPRIINLDRRRDPSRSIFNFFSRITASPPFRFSNSPRRSIDHSLLLRRMKRVYVYGFLRGFRVSKLGRVRRRASFAYL